MALSFLTGPTGSARLRLFIGADEDQHAGCNIITWKIRWNTPGIDPPGQVNPKAGITFANGLRAILRDPDVVMVGEIRDLETARMAVQAALTGHLVFSTLHTNDVPCLYREVCRYGD